MNDSNSGFGKNRILAQLKIPHEEVYTLSILAQTIYEFQGIGSYEETLEDHFRYALCEPLRASGIKYEFNFLESDRNDRFEMEFRVDGSLFDGSSIPLILKKADLIFGLLVQKGEGDSRAEIYNDARRSRFPEVWK